MTRPWSLPSIDKSKRRHSILTHRTGSHIFFLVSRARALRAEHRGFARIHGVHDAEQWLDATTVRYITETVNALGRRSELLVDSTAQRALSFKDGSVRIPVHTISFIHNKTRTCGARLRVGPRGDDGRRRGDCSRVAGAVFSQLIADTPHRCSPERTNWCCASSQPRCASTRWAAPRRAMRDRHHQGLFESRESPGARRQGDRRALRIYCAMVWNVGDRPPVG